MCHNHPCPNIVDKVLQKKRGKKKEERKMKMKQQKEKKIRK